MSVSVDDYQALRQILTGGRWRKAKTIPMRPSYIRQLCHQYPTEFVGTLHGYKLAEDCTLREIQWSINSLRSRARKINERADALETFSFQSEFDF